MVRTPEEVKKIRSTRLWRDEVRPTQLWLHPNCNICEQQDRLSEAVQVDHIEPLEEGGEPFDYENLQSLCFRCHVIKTAQENRDRNKLKKANTMKKLFLAGLLCVASFVSFAQSIALIDSSTTLIYQRGDIRRTFPKTGITTSLNDPYLTVLYKYETIFRISDYTLVTTPTASSMVDLQNKIVDILSNGAGTGISAGGTVTLTNKTMSGSSNTFSNIPYSAITNTPTTVAGYGITDISTTYQRLDNLQSNLSASTTKYPTINAVNTGLSLKQNLITTGTSGQYFLGDFTLATVPTIPTNANFIDVTSRQYGIAGNKNLTGGLALQSSSRGLWVYNATDTTNYQALKVFNLSGVFTVGSYFNGTGTLQPIRIGIGGTAGSDVLSRYIEFKTSPPFIGVSSTSSGSAGYVSQMSGTMSASTTVTQGALIVNPTVNQSNGAGYNALAVYTFEQATGSGGKYLIRAGKSSAAAGAGTLTDMFLLDNVGNVQLPVASTGLILSSPNGTKYKLTVTDAGVALFTAYP